MSTAAQLIIFALIIYGVGYWRGYRRGGGLAQRAMKRWLK